MQISLRISPVARLLVRLNSENCMWLPNASLTYLIKTTLYTQALEFQSNHGAHKWNLHRTGYLVPTVSHFLDSFEFRKTTILLPFRWIQTNLISSIASDTFTGMTSLEALLVGILILLLSVFSRVFLCRHLAGNRLSSLPSNLFTGLVKLRDLCAAVFILFESHLLSACFDQKSGIKSDLIDS
jgi:hypothetical protein